MTILCSFKKIKVLFLGMFFRIKASYYKINKLIKLEYLIFPLKLKVNTTYLEDKVSINK